MQNTGTEEGEDTLQQQQLGGQQARAGGINVEASTSSGQGPQQALVTQDMLMQDQTTKALESILERVGNPTSERTTRSGRKTPAAPVVPREDIRRYFTPPVPPAGGGVRFQPFAAHQHLLEQQQEPQTPTAPEEQQQPPGIQFPRHHVPHPYPGFRHHPDNFDPLEDEHALSNPVPTHPAAFASFFEFVSDSLKTCRFAQPRDLHEMAVLQPYGEVWNLLSSASRQKIWSRLQLFDLVSRYGWGQALKLYPGSNSIYSLPVDLAAPAGGRTSGWTAPGPPRQGQQQPYQDSGDNKTS